MADSAEGGQELVGVAFAVDEAMAILQQREPSSVDTDSVIDQSNHEELDDEYGITREILGPDYGDNLTASQVDFDQWMQVHALLESETRGQEQGSDTRTYEAYDDYEQAEKEYVYNGEDEEDDDEQQQNEQKEIGHDVRSAWANAQSSWRSDSEVADEDPISIGSSSDNEEEEENSDEDDAEHEVCGEYPDDEQSVSLSETVGQQETDQQSAANAMLLFLSNSVSAAAQQNDGADQPYERPPLPPLLANHTSSSLAEMHSVINRSIERSLAIVDEITSDCAKTEYSLAASECDYSSAAEHEEQGNDVDMENSCSDHEQLENYLNQLKAQILSLNTDVFQAECEKTELLERVSELEKANNAQILEIETLRKTHDEKTLVDAREIAVLKSKIKSIAEKTSVLSEKLDCSNELLAETKQALKIVDCERQDLVLRCSGLGESIAMLNVRLSKEVDEHRVAQNELQFARDGNASESRRLELESINVRLSQQCAELKTQLSLAHDKERLLLNTNRALEARLRDALRKEEQPMTPEDILADHRRAWDQQLIEARAVARQASESLANCESNLQLEKRINEQLRKRLGEMEVSQLALEQSARKRKLQEEVGAGESALENRWTIGENNNNSPGFATKAAALLATPTRPGMTEGKRRLLQASSGRFQQVVVDAGEYARERRRYRNASPLTERLPVTPRINLQGQHADVASLISPLRKSAR
ncbi:hypothetical protein LPJ57_004435 [Coemansia sp. RSA 486]|nr:hypothetical protein LPJ57_004435 [Coemansia sp. RSA 486]KAJ2231793.1 hypothetical protein IWW45_005375 [Coemansia sp. RSA 485]